VRSHASAAARRRSPRRFSRRSTHKDIIVTDRAAPPRGISRRIWVRLTAFQQRVYRAISAIPPGQTRSYGWVAKRIGRPRSARAVGGALRRNPFVPIVPCHRVIRSDGT
jgi:O-6-methylguanine DNA methyltransferase